MKRWLAILIAVVVLGTLIGWRLSIKRRTQNDQTQMAQMRKTAPASVVLASVTIRDILHTYDAVGSAEAPLNVKVASKVTGRLDYLQLREGDPVKQGEVLARIDPSQVLAQVSQQQAALAEAQSRYTQAKLTAGTTTVGVTTQIRQQQAGVSSAQANYNQVKQNYASQVAAANAVVTDAKGRLASAVSAIANAEAGVRSAQANLNNAQVKYNRTLSLYKQGYIAAQDVDDARTQLNVQQSAVDVAKGQLEATKSARDSAAAQVHSAVEQASIVVTKGKSDIEAAQQTLNQARAGLQFARSNTSQTTAYQANLAALRAGVEAAKAQVRNAQSQLADTVLRAPMAGYVTARYMDPGSVASAGAPILGIQAVRQVYITAAVPEDVSRLVFKGMPAQARFDALPNRIFHGLISEVNPAADPQSRQFTIRLLIDNAHNDIRPGMFGRISLITERIAHALVVPREAVHPGKEGPTVTLVTPDMVAHVAPVKTGAEDTLGIAILDGVKAGDRVVILSANAVRDGKKVRVAPGAPGGPGGRKRSGASGEAAAVGPAAR